MTQTGAPNAQSDKLSRNIIVLSWVSFFQDAATEMLFPILPIFITVVLGAPVAVVGIIEGCADGVASLLKGYSGWLADRLPRRPLIFAGYGTSAVSKGLIAFATTWPFVMFCRVLDRVGKGVRTSPRDVLIEADTTPRNRGRAFGFHRAMDSFGAVVGPLIGLALYEALHRSIRPLFLVAFVPALISVGLIWFVKEAPRPSKPRELRYRFDFSARYWQVLAILTAFNLVNFSVGLVIVRAKELGFATGAIFLLYALYNLTYALLSYPAGRLSDRFPRRTVFASGMALFAIAFLGFAFAREAVWAWPLFAVLGSFMALTDGVGTAWIADIALRDRVGSALGLYYACTGVAAIGAGLWAGLLWRGTGFLPFTVGGAVALVLAAILALMPNEPGQDASSNR